MSFLIRECSLAPLGKADRRPDEAWQAEVFESPVFMRSESGLVRPLVALVVEAASGHVFAAKVAEPGEEPGQALGDALVEAMRRCGIVPGEISTKAALAPELTALSRALGVSIVARGSMPALKAARQAMTIHLKKNKP